MNLVERVLLWLWDPSGRRRRAQSDRSRRTESKQRALSLAEKRVWDQVHRTQDFVSAHREDFN